MKNQNQRLMRCVIVAVMAAVSTVIYLIFPEIPLVVGVDFLKLDFSDLPALAAAASVGPIAGVLVEVLKNVLHLFQSTTLGIGELVNTIIGSEMCLSIALFSRWFARLLHRPRMSGPVYYLSAVCTLILTVLTGWLSNAVLMPVYFAVAGIPFTVQTVMVGVWGSTLLNVVKAALNLLPFYPLFVAMERAFCKIKG